MKSYLVLAILVLMLITSTGIFGFLSSAYQQDVLPLKEMEAKVTLLQQEEARLTERKKAIDVQISQLPPNYVRARQKLMESFSSELNKINTRIPQITTELQDLTNKKINQEAHTGPITFVAKALGQDVDDATKYMIFLIIFAFDPLAVMLTIGTNIALVTHKNEKEQLVKTPDSESVGVTQDIPTDDPSENEPNPTVTSTDQLREFFDDINQKNEPTEEELVQKSTIQEIQARRRVTDMTRNPTGK